MSSQSAATAGDATSANQTIRILDYPRDFFSLNEGKAPKDPTAAALMWQWRKDRPQNGMVETEPPNGSKRLKEMKQMRTDLMHYVVNAFH